MSTIYIPVLRKNKIVQFEDSLPSPLFGRISEEEWKEIITYINAILQKRSNRLIFQVLSPIVIGNILRTLTYSYVDKRVERYLEKKNLMLSYKGIHIHHPKERMYSGIDVSIFTQAVSPFNM